jgi:signal transduction histidine kinase
MTAMILLAAMVWVLTLRRRVQAQTAEIQRKVEREAVLEERTRIAREFHDTIEQQLAAVTLQVHAARTRLAHAPASAAHLLQFAEGMLRHTRSEARSSVWDLRARALEDGGLDNALRAIADYVRNGSTVEIEVSVTGNRHPFPSRIENHLMPTDRVTTAKGRGVLT